MTRGNILCTFVDSTAQFRLKYLHKTKPYIHQYLVVPAYNSVWLHLHTKISGCTKIHYCLVEAKYNSILLHQHTPKFNRTYYITQGLVVLDTPMSGSTYTLHCMVLLRYTKCMVVPTQTNVWLYRPHISMSSCTYIRQYLVYQNTAMSGFNYTHKMPGCNYTHKCLVVTIYANDWLYPHIPLSGCTYYIE